MNGTANKNFECEGENMNNNTLINNKMDINAIRFNQAGHRLFMAMLTARQLIDSCTLDHYDSTKAPDDPDQGYQRPPERSRITRIGTFLMNGSGNGLYPNALLLGARTPLMFNELTNRLQLAADQSLRVIDGQHRLEGLRYAIEEKGDTSVAEMQVPVVILEVVDRAEELDQFRIINGTAKSVRTDLVNAIITSLAERQGEEAILEKDRWKVVVTKAIHVLDNNPGSPWAGRLLMPDQTAKEFPDKIARATSVFTSMRPIYSWLAEFGFMTGKSFEEQADFLANIVSEYWRAIEAVTPDAFVVPDDYVIQKTPGLFALHFCLRDRLLPRIYLGRRQWNQETFQEFLQVSPEITDAEFWHKSANRASAYGSMKGFRELADLLNDSIEPD
jgi:DGQHR domain-containing protein